MNALGRHLILELWDCDPSTLQDLEGVRRALRDAALACGAIIVSESFYEFAPFGVSGFLIIAESHLSIHTWPEHRYAAADIFTCGDLIDPESAVQALGEALGCRRVSVMEIKRGILGLGQEKIPHKVLAPARADEVAT